MALHSWDFSHDLTVGILDLLSRWPARIELGMTWFYRSLDEFSQQFWWLRFDPNSDSTKTFFPHKINHSISWVVQNSPSLATLLRCCCVPSSLASFTWCGPELRVTLVKITPSVPGLYGRRFPKMEIYGDTPKSFYGFSTKATIQRAIGVPLTLETSISWMGSITNLSLIKIIDNVYMILGNHPKKWYRCPVSEVHGPDKKYDALKQKESKKWFIYAYVYLRLVNYSNLLRPMVSMFVYLLMNRSNPTQEHTSFLPCSYLWSRAPGRSWWTKSFSAFHAILGDGSDPGEHEARKRDFVDQSCILQFCDRFWLFWPMFISTCTLGRPSLAKVMLRFLIGFCVWSWRTSLSFHGSGHGSRQLWNRLRYGCRLGASEDLWRSLIRWCRDLVPSVILNVNDINDGKTIWKRSLDWPTALWW
jgi:hypothetical protein